MTNMPMGGGAASLGAVPSFLGLWVVMTVAMMLPSFAPTLWQHWRALHNAGEQRANQRTMMLGAGYFFAWTAVGVVVYPLVVALPRATTFIVALVVVIAGVVQLSAWKARRLARCREATGLQHAMPTDAISAWRHGLCLGWHCSLSCAAPMTGLLAIGMMDLRAMAIVTGAITLERLAPAGARVARVVGVSGVALGALMVARAAGWLPLTP